ncbi:cytochrome P450 [Nonomuraea sp. NPDC047897]|uniref:cytochrome P450 n=1 Tax=Nonomuraea sp. NPDC047897 TaxID=3364346 RepID=UPI003719263B
MSGDAQVASPERAAAAAAILRNPDLLYESLHKRGPVQWSEQGRVWLVVGYQAARSVLRDVRFRMPGPGADPEWGEGGAHGEFMRSLLLEAEGAHHERLRRALGPVFSPRTVRAREERIRAVTDELLAEIKPDTTFDGVATISARLPVSVVGDLVGVPSRLRSEVSALCRAISTGGGLASGAASADAVRSSIAALDELTMLVRDWLKHPELLPDGSVLATSAADPGTLTEAEIVANVFSLYLAGHDTSRNMLSALLFHLAGEESLLGDLATGRTTPAAEVERVLLGESPLTFTVRVALEEVRLEGELIAPGDRIRVMLGAANHDLRRTGQSGGLLSGVSFGEGRHVCLGAHVARLEGIVVLETVVRHWSTVALADEPQWTPHFLHRGLNVLPLEVSWRS